MTRTLIIILIVFSNWKTQATVVIGNSSNFRTLLPNLVAGDTLYLQPGNYSQSLRLEDLAGTLAQPILISGTPNMAKPVFLGNSCCNTVSLTRCEFVHISQLLLNGQNIVGIDAVKAEGSSGNWTHDIELSELEIFGYGADQQNVGISTKCPSWNWHVHHNIIDAAGTGMYFGNSDGQEPFASSIIEYNLIKNTIGYNCQVKHQAVGTRDLTIGMPASGKTTIRYNVFSKDDNASTGSAARPNLLVGNFPASGNGSTDYYEIYGNFFFQNPSEGLFQGTGNIGFYDNVLYNTDGGWGIAIQEHIGFSPRDIDVFHNTVLVSGSGGLRLNNLDGAYTQRVWANAVFAPSSISGSSLMQNIYSPFNQANVYIQEEQLPLSNLDLSPENGALQIAGIDLSNFNQYQDHDLDFDAKVRNGSYAGAYFSEMLPGWNLQLAIRTQVNPQTTSANINLGSNYIEVYPCPAGDTFFIDGLLSNYNIDILTSTGQVFQNLNTSVNVLEVDISALPSGLFFIFLRNKSNQSLTVQKMLKQ